MNSFHISSKDLYVLQPLVGIMKGWVIDEEIKNYQIQPNFIKSKLEDPAWNLQIPSLVIEIMFLNGAKLAVQFHSD